MFHCTEMHFGSERPLTVVMKAVGEDMDFQLQLLDEVPEADMADS